MTTESHHEDQSVAARVASWDGEAVILRHDAETRSWIVIALHSSKLGPATGGTRLAPYASLDAAIVDAQRLAAGMTQKWAAIDMPRGGGKAVLAVPDTLDDTARGTLVTRYAKLVESLRGTFQTGPDLGTTPSDMALLHRHTQYVHGIHEDGRVEDPGPYTAHGVHYGIRAALEHRFGQAEPADRDIVIVGVGAVGAPLARELVATGARVTIADVDRARCDRLHEELACAVIDLDAAHSQPCDVYAPCAIGNVLNEKTIPELRCQIVAGSANNQLGAATDAALLHERGILYAPDYIINGGGAIAFGRFGSGERDRAQLLGRVEQIEATLRMVFANAGAASPLDAAERWVARRLRDAE